MAISKVTKLLSLLGKIILNPSRSELKDDMVEAELEDFSRLTSGGSFTVSGAPPVTDHTHVFPPSKITDLEAKFQDDHIQLSWTAPGNVLDEGKGKLDNTFLNIWRKYHWLSFAKNFLMSYL